MINMILKSLLTTKNKEIDNAPSSMHTQSITNYGTIQISEYVIAEIVRRSVLEINDVVELIGNKSIINSLARAIYNRNTSNDVIILKMHNNVVEIKIKIAILYNENITILTNKIQNNILTNIKYITGLNTKINIIIDNIKNITQ